MSAQFDHEFDQKSGKRRTTFDVLPPNHFLFIYLFMSDLFQLFIKHILDFLIHFLIWYVFCKYVIVRSLQLELLEPNISRLLNPRT